MVVFYDWICIIHRLAAVFCLVPLGIELWKFCFEDWSD